MALYEKKILINLIALVQTEATTKNTPFLTKDEAWKSNSPHTTKYEEKVHLGKCGVAYYKAG